MKIGVIAGSHPRHDLFVSELSKVCKINGFIQVIREEMVPEAPKYLDDEISLLWELHFQRRATAENRWFGSPKLGELGQVLAVSPEGLNGEVVQHFVQRMKWDLLMITGVPIIKAPLLSMLPPWTANFHMGLMPEWRGSITTFWPMYMFQPQNLGVTFHVIAPEVDAGQILHQYRPELQRGWGLHDTSCAAYLGGCQEIGKVVKYIEEKVRNGEVPKLDPNLSKCGKVYLKRDWHPQMLKVMYEFYEDKIVDMYLNGELGKGFEQKLVRIN